MTDLPRDSVDSAVLYRLATLLLLISGSQDPNSRSLLLLTYHLTIVSLLRPRVANSHCFDVYQLRYRPRLTRRHVSRKNLPSRVLPQSTLAYRKLVQTISTYHALPQAHSFQITHSRTDIFLPLAVDTNLAPDEVNRTPLKTSRCPNSPRLDYRGTTVEKTIPSRRSQTEPSQIFTDVGTLMGNPKYNPSSRTCAPPNPYITSEPLGHAQPLTQRALRYIRQNIRRAADDSFPSPAHTDSAYERFKTILPTVAGSIISTDGSPAQIQATKREHEYEPNRGSLGPSPNPRTSREVTALPSSPRAPHSKNMNSKISSNENLAMAASAAAPTSPSATAETDSANVSPSAPLLLRTAANPGLGRSRDQRPSSPLFSTQSQTLTHYPPCLAMRLQPLHERYRSFGTSLHLPPPWFYLAQTLRTMRYTNYMTIDRLPHQAPRHNTASTAVLLKKMQAKYRTLDTRRVPKVQPLQFSAHTDRTAAIQLLVQ